MEQDAQSSPVQTETSSHRNADHTADALDETAVENVSIIGKVKSRVSSILPNSLSKWFSPTAKNRNDSFNGNLHNSVGGIGRRRRRIEMEDDDDEYIDEEEDADDDDEDDEPDEQEADEYEDNIFLNQQDNSDDDSSNSEATVSQSDRGSPRSLNIKNPKSSVSDHQPPKKRSRLNLDNSTSNKIRNIPLMARPPLVASTPDYGEGFGSGAGAGCSTRYTSSSLDRPVNRYTHLNLYAGQRKKEPAYNFNLSPNTMTQSNTLSRYNDPDIIDLVPEEAIENCMRTGESGHIRSRRTLNIPPSTTMTATTGSPFRNCKRQSASDMASQANTSGTLTHARPRRTSTTIFEADSNQHQLRNTTIPALQEEFEVNDDYANEVDETQETNVYNGRGEEVITSKRPKLINGSNDVNIRDSVSESSEATSKPEHMDASGACTQVQQKTTGLFNMSAVGGGRNGHGSRTSSFGNSLNFYTHLDGRKSLFADNGKRSEKNGETLNSSTLSLTSLNRRQFNASIYGSTAALSDSRLLNTFSPFYKGRTTYGGAAAYKKYSTSGASSVRITPTLIRPTSSLSTLSSSNNSLNHAGTHVTENTSGISSTAKRILDLINDFSTPLTEAKKMASHLKTSHQQQQQQLQQQQNQTATKVRRFNETDLNATRAMRLSQVRTPYARPSVTLQPKNKPSNSTLLPPVRELQVPSMSQLLQMKKLQNTTERSRLIVKENGNSRVGAASLSAEYTLPTNLEDADANRKQKQHTNKIRSKITSSARIAGSSKDVTAEIMDNNAPLNLPNIAFPLMESVPKFDIKLPAAKSVSQDEAVSSALKSFESMTSTSANNTSNVPLKEKNHTILTNTPSTVNMVAVPSSPPRKTDFRFSMPLQLDGVCLGTSLISPINDNYKFSPPVIIEQHDAESKSATNTTLATKPTPQLKTGSVLDALKKPFLVSGVNAATNGKSDSLFAQFKKSVDEWVCGTCLVPNKKDALKCVACETARKVDNVANTNISSLSSSIVPQSEAAPVKSAALSSGFGNQFKTSSNEWECSVCMIRNSKDVAKCAACETPRAAINTAGNRKDKLSSDSVVTTGNSFAQSFKPRADTWECPTCLIYNKQTSNECLACGTKKLAAGSVMTNSGSSKSHASNASSASFRQLAATQSFSKWECEVCMTRNDKTRLKCVWCEQAKPGALTNENAPKFSFGSTAAAKFSFGFNNQNTPKEEELRKLKDETISKERQQSVVPVPPTKGMFSLGSAEAEASKPNSTAFTFGVKPTVDETDAKKTLVTPAKKEEGALTAASILPTQFKFGEAAAPAAPVATTASATAATGGFSFGTKVTTTAAPTTTKTNDSLFNSPTPKDTTAAKTASVFGSSSSQSPVVTFKSPQQSSSSSVSFKFAPAVKPAADVTKSVTAEVPKSTGIVFKPVDPTCSTLTAVSSSSKNTFTFGATPQHSVLENATPVSGFKTVEAMKPLFTFGSSSSTLSSSSTPACTTATSPAAAPKTSAAGFSFSNVAPSSTSTSTSSTTPLKTSFFVGAPATATATATAITANKTSVPQTTTALSTQLTTTNVTSSNIFGSFTAGSTTLNNAFSHAQPASVNSAANTTTSFGAVASAASPSIFGAFSNNDSNSVKSKAIASPSVFGAPSSSQTKGPFSFSAKAATVATTTNANNTSIPVTAATSTSAATTSWPKNSFVFGSSSTLSAAASTTTSDANKVQGFGNNFGSSLAPSASNSPAAASSIFGTNLQVSSINTPTAANTFGSSLFGAASPPVAAGVASTNNLFGSVTASSSAPSAFGSSTFGNNSSSIAEPKFGSTAPPSASAPNPPSSFGSFGAVAAASSSTVGDGASAAKKSEPAFNFGAAPAASQTSSSGGFNFGGNVAKPAFNFGASTGTVANFNFTGTTTEATPNAPFQFNAGGTQPAPSNNIFAPSPTPVGAQSGQQARRKIRAPMRRLTPR